MPPSVKTRLENDTGQAEPFDIFDPAKLIGVALIHFKSPAATVAQAGEAGSPAPGRRGALLADGS